MGGGERGVAGVWGGGDVTGALGRVTESLEVGGGGVGGAGGGGEDD